MIANAMDAALATLNQGGKWLWLYGEVNQAGEVYSPYCLSAGAQSSPGRSISTLEDMDDHYDAVAAKLPKQWEEAQGLLALAFQKSRRLVIASAANDAGGRRLACCMESFGVKIHQLSKHHQRAVWSLDASAADPAMIEKFLPNLAPRRVDAEGESWWSLPGLFAWDRVDPASRLLLEHLPENLAGRIADFGCGYGYLSASLAKRYASITRIDAYDYDRRAVECCVRNAGAAVHTHWQDVTCLADGAIYDAIVMNPPFHSGKARSAALGQLFITKAWEHLKPGGKLFLVANRQLPYERAVEGLRELHAAGGYKILTGCKP